MPFPLSLAVFSLIVCALVLLFLLQPGGRYPFLKTIHREQKIGSLVAALALGWSGVQGFQLLGEDFPRIAGAIPLATPLLIIAVYFLMDYIFTRALGGLLIMLICDLLFQTQELQMPGRVIFSLAAYALAVAGMYMIGQPWRYRDLLFKAAADRSAARRIAVWPAACGLLVLIPLGLAYV
jgi:hypothetical protein